MLSHFYFFVSCQSFLTQFSHHVMLSSDIWKHRMNKLRTASLLLLLFSVAQGRLSKTINLLSKDSGQEIRAIGSGEASLRHPLEILVQSVIIQIQLVILYFMFPKSTVSAGYQACVEIRICLLHTQSLSHQLAHGLASTFLKLSLTVLSQQIQILFFSEFPI